MWICEGSNIRFENGSLSAETAVAYENGLQRKIWNFSNTLTCWGCLFENRRGRVHYRFVMERPSPRQRQG